MTDSYLLRVARIVALIGVLIAGYLTWVHFSGATPLCVAGGGGCEKVQTSDYADLFGIPVALLGLLGYATILAATFIAGDNGRLITLILAAVAFAFSAYLTYLELVVIDAICQWCVGSAVVATVLVTVCAVRYLRGDDLDKPGAPAAPCRTARAVR